jgi:iron complex outermembrane receptor protein
VHASEQTLDFDFQHRVTLGSRHDVVWGGGYRVVSDEILPGYSVSLNPPRRTYSLFSGFFQDEIALSPSFSLTLGSKLENNAFTGTEAQPTISLLWSPSDHQAAWVSVARAIRQPSCGDRDARLNSAAFPGPGGLPVLLSIFGSSQFHSETLVAYEAGYRLEAGRRLSFDAAAFYNSYHRLRTTEPETPFLEADPVPHLVTPFVFANKFYGHSYGSELSGTWSILDRWRLTGSYSWLQLNLHADPSSFDKTPRADAGPSPQHQFQVRSYLNLPHHLEFDNSLYYVGQLQGLPLPAYARLDSRLGWRFGESAEISLVGQNLLGPHHLEFPLQVNQAVPTQPARSVFARIVWHF